jgi:hypothetical protein
MQLCCTPQLRGITEVSAEGPANAQGQRSGKSQGLGPRQNSDAAATLDWLPREVDIASGELSAGRDIAKTESASVATRTAAAAT